MARRGRSNCFVFALLAWWRWRRDGAYFAVRQSRHITGWHWLVYHRGRWVHFEPQRVLSGWRAAAHKLWYRGYVRRGDK